MTLSAFAQCTRNFVSEEQKFEDEIYVPKLKTSLKAYDMARLFPLCSMHQDINQ